MVRYEPIGPSDDPVRERDTRELGEVLRGVRNIVLQELTLTIGGPPVSQRHGVDGVPWIVLQAIGDGVTAELRAVNNVSYQVALTGAGSGTRRVLALVVDPQ